MVSSRLCSNVGPAFGERLRGRVRLASRATPPHRQKLRLAPVGFFCFDAPQGRSPHSLVVASYRRGTRFALY